MAIDTAKALDDAIRGVIDPISATDVRAVDEAALRTRLADEMGLCAATAADTEARDRGRWMIRAAARSLGIRLASIQKAHMALGRGEAGPFTCPAMNIRGVAYELAEFVQGAHSQINAKNYSATAHSRTDLGTR